MSSKIQNESNNQEKIGFKLIKRRYSRISKKEIYNSLSYSGRVTYYDIGKETRPREGDGPLGVFISEEHARNYYNTLTCPNRRLVILYRCKYTPSNENGFWVRRMKKKVYFKLHPSLIPEGTDFASSITLLEEVEI